MHPNERGRDKATGIKNDRFSVNPKSSLWLTSLLCKLSFCYSKCLPVPQAATCSIAGLLPGRWLHHLPNRHWKRQECVPEPGSLSALLLVREVILFYLWESFYNIFAIYSPEWFSYMRGSRVRVRQTLLLLKILFYLLILPIFLVWLVVRFPSCTSQKKTAKFCNLIYYCFIC